MRGNKRGVTYLKDEKAEMLRKRDFWDGFFTAVAVFLVISLLTLLSLANIIL